MTESAVFSGIVFEFIRWLVHTDFFTPVLLGILGGFVRDMNSERYSLGVFVVGFVSSGFVSLLVYLAFIDFDISEKTRLFSVGAAGFCYRSVLDFVNYLVMKRIEKLKDKEDVEIKGSNKDV